MKLEEIEELMPKLLGVVSAATELEKAILRKDPVGISGALALFQYRRKELKSFYDQDPPDTCISCEGRFWAFPGEDTCGVCSGEIKQEDVVP
jgi:hypothetical protein